MNDSFMTSFLQTIEAAREQLSIQNDQLQWRLEEESCSLLNAQHNSLSAPICDKHHATRSRTIVHLPTELRQKIIKLAVGYHGCALCNDKTYVDFTHAIRMCLTFLISPKDVEDMLKSLLAREDLQNAQNGNPRRKKYPGYYRGHYCSFDKHFYSHGHCVYDLKDMSSFLTMCVGD